MENLDLGNQNPDFFNTIISQNSEQCVSKVKYCMLQILYTQETTAFFCLKSNKNSDHGRKLVEFQQSQLIQKWELLSYIYIYIYMAKRLTILCLFLKRTRKWIKQIFCYGRSICIFKLKLCARNIQIMRHDLSIFLSVLILENFNSKSMTIYEKFHL